MGGRGCDVCCEQFAREGPGRGLVLHRPSPTMSPLRNTDATQGSYSMCRSYSSSRMRSSNRRRDSDDWRQRNPTMCVPGTRGVAGIARRHLTLVRLPLRRGFGTRSPSDSLRALRTARHSRRERVRVPRNGRLGLRASGPPLQRPRPPRSAAHCPWVYPSRGAFFFPVPRALQSSCVSTPESIACLLCDRIHDVTGAPRQLSGSRRHSRRTSSYGAQDAPVGVANVRADLGPTIAPRVSNERISPPTRLNSRCTVVPM